MTKKNNMIFMAITTELNIKMGQKKDKMASDKEKIMANFIYFRIMKQMWRNNLTNGKKHIRDYTKKKWKQLTISTIKNM